MTEKNLRKQVEKYLKTLPVIWFYHPADRWQVGLPDFIICYKGKFCAVELKQKGKALRKIQEYALNKIKEAGGRVKTVYSLEDVKKLLNKGR